MFRFVVAVLAALGLGALIFGGGVATVAGLVVLAPLFFIFKIMLFFVLFGSLSGALRGVGGRHRRRVWFDTGRDRPQRGGHDGTGASGGMDRFEEWHRMAHAREEVDSWAPDDV